MIKAIIKEPINKQILLALFVILTANTVMRAYQQNNQQPTTDHHI